MLCWTSITLAIVVIQILQKVLLFSFGKDVVEKVGSTKLSDVEIDKNLQKYTYEILAKAAGKTVAEYTAGYAVVKSISDEQKIRDYLKKHPNSELSKKEI